MSYSSVIDDFSKKKILVVGDILLDHYIYGTTSRISPEAPVPVISFREEFFSPGGAANVAVNLSALNADVRLVGIIGKDSGGSIITEELKSCRIPKKYIIAVGGYHTPTKTRLISDSQQIVRLDREIIERPSPKTEKKTVDTIRSVIRDFRPDALVISDYNKGLLTERILSAAIKSAKENKTMIVVDPKGTDFSKYRRADVITPNLAEAENVCGFGINNEKEVGNALKKIKKITGIDKIFITRGKDGTSYLISETKTRTIASAAKDVYDVTGAGDTFISVLTLGLLCSQELETAVHLANSAAGIVIERTGTSSLTPDELNRRINRDTGQKLISGDSIVSVANTLKSQGKKIVFTNGCFDLFHSGHLRLLEKSREMGDVLIVGLNSDGSVRKLKGKERPFISQQERISIISALSCVDHVAVFDEPTPAELIQIIKPMIITKGGDYNRDEVVGRDTVEEYGGEVRIIPISRDISTSGIVRTIRGNNN